MDAWAAQIGMAPRTLARRFLAETGLPLGAWRQQARLMRAQEMLVAGSAVTTVALELGYDNISAFIAMFKREVGITPGRFRGPVV
ncbi:Bifunctional transcriptional activator/DNA repair enzyme Ada [compost metagenome]